MLLPFAGYALTGERELDAQGETLARLYSPKLISLSTSGEQFRHFRTGSPSPRARGDRLDLRRESEETARWRKRTSVSISTASPTSCGICG